MTDETPRLPSSFPKSPLPRRRVVRDNHELTRKPSTLIAENNAIRKDSSGQLSVKTVQKLSSPNPLISLEVADAPTQRLYIFGIFALLQTWKLYDLSALVTGEQPSFTDLWFFVKWLAVDSCFFVLLPIFRIPWLTFTQSNTLVAIVTMSVLNVGLSLRFYSYIAASFGGFWKILYDRELSISERSVKWYDIVNNNSHIQGRYTVHILPEGAAKINPDGHCYCLGPESPTVIIPIQINGTQPIKIELVRIDLETSLTETINMPRKEVKRLFRKSPREDSKELRYLPYEVKKPGLYRLGKVTDTSELDVRVQRSEAMVVTCPTATINSLRSPKTNLCKGDMSELAIELQGLAPLWVTYSRILNGKSTTFTAQRLHPENFESPLLAGFQGTEIILEEGDDQNLRWARPQSLIMPVNEPLDFPGSYLFEIEKVGDACGNVIDFKTYHDEADIWGTKSRGFSYGITVHQRPILKFSNCNTQKPMDLPRGKSAALPFSLDGEGPYSLRYSFTPNNLGDKSEHAIDNNEKEIKLKSSSELMVIREPGLYTLRSISNAYCAGDLMEPTTCLVITPPNPSLTLEHSEILNDCSGSSVGLLIDLTLVGSPPFVLSYRRIKDGDAPTVERLQIHQSRHQTRFVPTDAGHYIYEFFNLDDKNYVKQQLDTSKYRVEQTVKPVAGAEFADCSPRKACIDDQVHFDIKIQGTPPLTLNYDLIHGGKRTRFSTSNITTSCYKITTPHLANGGDYALALTSVQDKSGCKSYLKTETQITVRFQRPKAQFAPVDGKLRLDALANKQVNLPVRLTGEAPWTMKFKNIDVEEPPRIVTMKEANSVLQVTEPGTYEIESVHDNSCPGSVVDSQSKFILSWIPRPEVRLPVSSSVSLRDNIYSRNDICQGDEDSVELAFTGKPPFIIDWERRFKKAKDSKYFTEKTDSLTAGLDFASVRLESAKPGQYQYRFFSLLDSLYDDPSYRNIKKPLILEQTIHPKPETMFANPNKVYKYCLDSAVGDDSIIPIQLSGSPPFSLTLNVKHFSTGESDTIHIPNIESNKYDFKIPTHALTLGDHAVSALKVKDSRGCFRKTLAGPHVMVAVADMPKISATDHRNDYCVGERIAFTLAGVPPFAVEYEWNGVSLRATNQPPQFVRVAERPGNFTVKGLQDSASDCKVHLNMKNVIHEVPSVRISEGKAVVKGISEGDQAEILFTFFGTPPFTFTYTRSEIVKKATKSRILEMHSQVTNGYTYSLFASQEGTYEVISIEDKHCSYTTSSAGRKQ